MQQLKILGIKITSATMEEIHKAIDHIMQSKNPGILLSANVHAVNLARRRPWLAEFFNNADLIHVDGAGIIWGARLLGYEIPERITWADWVWPLIRHMAEKKYSLFMLGGPKGLTDQAAKKLKEHTPLLNIVGTHHGYFKKKGQENDELIKKINQAAPDIIWIGMGMPLQERWLWENRHRLNARLFMICGAAYKHMAGQMKRAPGWFIEHDMEWLWLLLQDPGRGIIRYLWGNPFFMLNVFIERYKTLKS
ncbi:N-acetylglucosaminyldiphosphoundecaprenol N-acetyl-beta-D-mannosaminyltransferase [Desulfonema limicola]|uniref:N-acetylglucosaminyldiphosphoundecaprenol N-acetyl-beta-D-mannosaminyltransferase n=1 Tax=Desulfonema limicola TaxID=45656 RepID=A0A975GJE2_9BACT|nr:WecB/TagA/CpsF family glycosyltransferase [Desulfonema limicola]QTA83322.1 N-acetylglucosaminyldiphosphoundecaprenol N-acetyl-beta-D-mannosaminyltransferase [Desulfonema limicola]